MSLHALHAADTARRVRSELPILMSPVSRVGQLVACAEIDFYGGLLADAVRDHLTTLPAEPLG